MVRNLAAKYESIWEGVHKVVGGQVLEYEAKTILNRGLERGRAEGREEGRAEFQTSVNTLNLILINNGRLNDLRRSAEDTDYQQQLMDELLGNNSDVDHTGDTSGAKEQDVSV